MKIFKIEILSKNFFTHFILDLWQLTFGIKYLETPVSGVLIIFFGPFTLEIERSPMIQNERMLAAIKEHEEGRCGCDKSDRARVDELIGKISEEKK